MGFQKVSEMKRSVATTIRDFVVGGGFLFTMCSGTDSYDIALAAQEVDICAPMFDGDPADPTAPSKLQFEDGLAFQDYQLEMDPLVYEFSSIDGTEDHSDIKPINDFFTLFDFSAKWDIVPTMLTQNHERVIAVLWGKRHRFAKNTFVLMLQSWATTEICPRPNTSTEPWGWVNGRTTEVMIRKITDTW